MDKSLRISKNIVFHIAIVESSEADHTILRKTIQATMPQAIVESFYNDDEALQHFNHCSRPPHIIFLDQNMLHISGRDTLDLIKHIQGLEQVPIVVLSDPKSQSTDLFQQGESHFYSRPYSTQDLLQIVGYLNTKWLA